MVTGTADPPAPPADVMYVTSTCANAQCRSSGCRRCQYSCVVRRRDHVSMAESASISCGVALWMACGCGRGASEGASLLGSHGASRRRPACHCGRCTSPLRLNCAMRSALRCRPNALYHSVMAQGRRREVARGETVGCSRTSRSCTSRVRRGSARKGAGHPPRGALSSAVSSQRSAQFINMIASWPSRDVCFTSPQPRTWTAAVHSDHVAGPQL
jgi:hypothetical protein